MLSPIPPDRLVPLAETAGLIVRLGLKLMGIAVAQAATWRDELGDSAPRINLNFSPLQLATDDMVAEQEWFLDWHDLTPNAIGIEVTESIFCDSRATRGLELARELGCKVTMDDFGVGYSSLSQLPRLPVSVVKLDGNFVVESTGSIKETIMLALIVRLAHGLDLTVVAEGEETLARLSFVSSVGCDAVQGYIYARPIKMMELEVWLAERYHSGRAA